MVHGRHVERLGLLIDLVKGGELCLKEESRLRRWLVRSKASKRLFQ